MSLRKIEKELKDYYIEKENNKPKEKKKHISPKEHPWRKNMMLRKNNWGSVPYPEV